MEIIKHSKIIDSPKSGNIPCRFELVDKDYHYTVRMCGWDGKKWIVYIPCHWQAEKTEDNLTQGYKILQEAIMNHLRGLIVCEFDFCMRSEK
jgi:hypothetical protein